jgi:hypothetical protein
MLYRYISGHLVDKVNVAKLRAAFPDRHKTARKAVNHWCSTHSFECTVAVSGGFFLLGLLV